MARSEARVLVSLPRHLQKCWYAIPMEPCLWEEKCFPVNQSIYYSNIAGWKVPAKPFRAIFALKEFLVDLSMGQFKFEQGQFCSFFPQVIGLCFLGNKVDEAILSQIFFESEDQFWHPCGFFFLSWWLLFLYLLLTEKKNNTSKRSQTFHHYVEHILKDFHPNKKKHHPTHTLVSGWIFSCQVLRRRNIWS